MAAATRLAAFLALLAALFLAACAAGAHLGPVTVVHGRSGGGSGGSGSGSGDGSGMNMGAALTLRSR